MTFPKPPITRYQIEELEAALAEKRAADAEKERADLSGAAEVQDAKQREPWQEGQPEWRTGGSPGTHGLTLYRRNELAGLMLDAEDAKDIVGVMNLDGDRPLRVAEFVERAKRERDDLAAKLTEAGQHIVSAQSRLGQCQDRVAVLDRACLRFGVEAANYERAIAEAKEERDQACEGELQRAEERNAAETRAAEAEQKRSVSDEKLRLGEKILARGARDLAAAEALIELKDKALRKCSAQLASDYVDLKRENEAIATAQAALSTVPNEALLAFATRIAEAMLEEAARIIETDSSPRAKRWGPVFEEICRDRAKTLRWFLQEGRSAFGAFLKQVIDPVL